MTEHQSTINLNMPVRFLIYLGRTYEKLIQVENVYKESQIQLDSPSFIVFYNGDASQPPYSEMHLSDAFSDGSNSAIDLKVQMYNINYDENKEILKRSKLLRGYSFLVAQTKKLQQDGLPFEAALKQSIKTCIERDVLAEILRKDSSEVYNMFTIEYDAEMERKALLQEGMKKGMEKGMEKGIEVLISFLIEDGESEDEIVRKLEEKFDISGAEAKAYYERFAALN